MLLYSGTVWAVTFFVNDLNDTVDIVPGNGVCADASGHCTLRAAVIETNALAGADKISLMVSGTYFLNIAGSGVADEDLAQNGDLDIADDLEIQELFFVSATIDGNGTERIFELVSPELIFKIKSIQLQNGSASFTGTSGGGMLLDEAGNNSITLQSVTVIDNYSRNRGGAVYTTMPDTTLNIINSSFQRNEANTSGGALYMYDSSFSHLCRVLVDSSEFLENTSGYDGGAIYISGCAQVTLQNSVTISANQATNDAGGLRLCDNTSVNLSNTLIDSNSSGSYAGGLYSIWNTSISVTRSNITNNESGVNTGGAFFLYDTNVSLQHTSIVNNVAANRGGGLYFYGVTATIDSALIEQNSSDDVAGVYIGYSNVAIEDSSIINNTITDALLSDISGLSTTESTVQIDNTTFSGNTGPVTLGVLPFSSGADTSHVVLHSVTIARNNGLGIGNTYSSTATIEATNSLIAQNTGFLVSGLDCYGGVVSNGYNLVGATDSSCTGFSDPTDLVGSTTVPINPYLRSLGLYGGSTPSHALASTSPANGASNDCLATDQRGFARPSTGCSIGSFEY